MEELRTEGLGVVVIGPGTRSGELLPEREERRRVAVITQPGAARWAREAERRLKGGGYRTGLRIVPDGEAAKSLSVAADLYDWLVSQELGRADTILGVGGGSVTDLAGFVAATWLRGVELCLLPTTLVGAVDAAIGGKTALNLRGKNLVGAFWPASRVTIDTEILADLPERLARDGLAEALKAGVVGDPGLVGLLVQSGREAPIEQVIRRAVMVKLNIVGHDLREQGPRRVLNYGHTIGHAIELAGGLTHGEAVAVGMAAAGLVSEELLGFQQQDRLEDALRRLDLPRRVEGIPAGRVEPLLWLDKKRGPVALRMVLLREIGRPEVVEVDTATVGRALTAIGVT